MASFAETRKKRVEEGSTGSSSGNSGGTSKKQNENTNTGAGGFRAARIAELNRRNKSKDDFEPYETTWTPDELKNSGAQLAAATRQAWTPERIERSRQRTTYTIPEPRAAATATRERPDNFLSNLMEGYTQRRLEKLKADQLRDQLNERRQATDLFRADRERIEAAKTAPARQSSYLDLDEYRKRLEGMRQEQAERDEQERRNLIYGIVQDTMDGNRAITPYSEMAGTPEYERAVQTGQSMRHGLPERKYLGNEPGYFLRNDQTYYMTDAERDAYNYLLASRGTDTAKQYLDALKGDLDTRAAEAQHEAARNIGRTMPVRGSLYDTFLSTVAAPAGYLYAAGQQFLGNDVDPNARQFEGVRMDEATREGLKENRIPFLSGREIPVLGGDASDFVWDTGLSMIQSAARAPLGGLGLGLAGLGAASSGYLDARDRGADNGRAMISGALQGGAETFFEKFSLKGLESLKASPAKSFKDFLVNMGKQGLTEGSEEVFTEIANTISDSLVMGELSQYNQDLLTYQAQGIPEEEAKLEAFGNIMKRIGLAGLGGAVSGGVMGGGAQALGMAGEQMYYNDIGQSFNPDFRQYAERIITDPNEYANEEDWQEATRLQGLAQEYAERQRNRETIPARERGQYAVDFARMAETSERNLQEQAVKNALDSLVKEGDERADQDMDPEEAVAEPEGKDQISEAKDQIPEENDQLTAENDQIPAEYAQEPEQEYLDQMADEYGQEAEEWYPEEPEGWEPEEIIDQTNPAPGTDLVEEYAGINRGTDQTDRVSAIAESMNQGPVVETNTRQAAMSEIETELAENNRQRAGILSEQFGQNGQKAFQDNYDGSMDPGLYSRAFGRAYDAGRYDVDMSIAERSALLSSLGSDQVEAAYLAGIKDREATYRMNDDTGEIKDLRQGAKKTGGLGTVENGATSEQRAVASHVGKLTGLTIDLVEGSGAAGGRASYGGGRITIDINSDDFMGDMSHELTHFIRDYSPDLYRMYEDRAVQALMASRNESLDTMIESYQTAYEQAGQNLTRDQIMEEIVADAAQAFLNDEEFIQEAAKGNKSISERIMQFINDVIDALKQMLKNTRQRKAAAVLREDIRTLEYARTMWLAALEEGSERYRSGKEVMRNNENQQETRYRIDGVDVEETDNKDLVAIHNLSEEKLMSNLELGGFPAPSIAIGKAEVGHEGYGDISVVFRKDTIDPQMDKRNKIYSADAYTTRFPQIDYQINEKALKKLSDRLDTSQYSLESNVFERGEPEAMVRRLSGMREAREAFVKEKGIKVEPVITRITPKMMARHEGTAAREFLARPDVSFDDILYDDTIRQEYIDSLTDGKPEKYRSGITRRVNEMVQGSIEDPAKYQKQAEYFEKDQNIARGTAALEEHLSYEDGLKNAIEEQREEYDKWVKDLISPVVGDKFIRNNKEPYDRYGNRKSFKALHYPYTIENIVKVMAENGGKNAESGLMSGSGEVRAAVSRDLTDIESVRDESRRIQNLSDEEISEIYKEMDDMLLKISGELAGLNKSGNEFIDQDNAIENMVEAYGKGKTRAQIKKILGKYYGNISDSIMDEVMELREYAMDIPVRYFEAKPMRPIGFDEVAAVVVPNTASEDLKSQLEERDVKVVTYDPNLPDARREAVSSLEDVRFRLDGVDDSRSEKIIEALLLENKNLKEALEHYKHELELTSGEELRQEDIKKVGKKLLHNYKSGYDEEKLAKQLTRIYEYLRSGDKDAINVQDVAEIATALGRSILMKSQDIDKTMLEQYKDVRKQIRDTKIYLDQQDRADLDSRGGYNKFRRDNFGKIKLGNGGMSVDSFYQILSDANPELFPIEIATPADQLMRIADVMDFTAGQMQNPYYANMDEMSYIVGQEILDAYFDVRNVPPTFADKKAQERDRIRDQYKAKMEQYKKDLRSQAMRAMNQIQKQNEGMVIAAERKVERAELAMAAMEQRHMKRTQDMRDRQQANADKKIIMKEAKALSDWLLKPTDKKHIPDALRIPVAEFLKGIDFSSDRSGPEGGPTQRTMQWRDLTDTLDAIIKAEGVLSDQGKDYFIDLDPDLSERIKEIAKKTQGLEKLDRLDPYDMSELKKTVYAMKKALTEANQLKSNKKATEVGKLADGVFGDLNSRKGRIEFTGVIGGVDRLINYDMLDSYTMFHSMGENMGSLQESLRSGLDTKTRLVKIASDHTENLLSTLGLKESDIKEITGSNAKATTFKVKGGEISLTVAQVMSLYELEKRGQSRDHIYNPFGGIKQAPRVSKAKWVNGKLVPGQIIRQYSPVSVSKEDVRNIINTLTPEQKALADGLQKFMGDECAKWGNQVTMEMYGYNKFTAKNYFPIVTDKNYISTKDGDLSGQQLSTIKNMGITKATVQHANNPIIIEDIFDVFTRQVDQMSSYNAYVIPLSDMQKVFNFKDMQGGGSVKQEIERTFGPEGNRYIQQLMVSINGTLNTDRSLGEDMMSNMKAASVAGNLRVAIQQPTAYIRAAAEIDPKYLLRGAATITEKEQWDRICKYAPIAQWKDWGFYRMEVSRQLKDIMFGTDSKKQAFVNKSMVLAEIGDKMAWNRLWRACEYETMDLHPELEQGSEEFYSQVGQRFSEIIDKTQVVDSVLHRTQIMRSSNAFNKMATAFMGEPLKSYNMIYRAAIDLKSKQRGSLKKATRVAATYLATATATALAAAVMDATRDDDREKGWLEKYREAFLANLKDGVNIINNIPYAKEIISISQGYSSTRSDVAWMQDLYYAWNRIQKLYNGNSQYTPQAVAVYTAQQLSKVLGIPIKSISRDAGAFIDTAMNKLGGGADYTWLRQQYSIENSGNLSMYVNMMNEAYRAGNMNLYNKIRSDLNNAGITDDKISKKAKSLVMAELVSKDTVHPLIEEAAEAKLNMDLQTYEEAINALADEEYAYDLINEAVKKRTDQIQGDDEEDTDQEEPEPETEPTDIMEKLLRSGSGAGGRPSSVTGYSNADIIRSIEMFDRTPASLDNFKKITAEMVAAKTADGSKKESDVVGNIKSAITKEYKPKWISGDQKTRQEIQQKLMYLKVGEKTLYSSDDWSSWMKAAKKN